MKLPLAKPGPSSRQPLRTLQELAEEFGVSPQRLKNVMAAHDGPKPELRHEGGLSRGQTWYKPQDVRKWWSELNWKPRGEK